MGLYNTKRYQTEIAMSSHKCLRPVLFYFDVTENICINCITVLVVAWHTHHPYNELCNVYVYLMVNLLHFIKRGNEMSEFLKLPS